LRPGACLPINRYVPCSQVSFDAAEPCVDNRFEAGAILRRFDQDGAQDRFEAAIFCLELRLQCENLLEACYLEHSDR
jgi:hypothetical protein